MDRRHIRTRMNEIKLQLKTVVEHRERYRNQREQNQVFQIALIGTLTLENLLGLMF